MEHTVTHQQMEVLKALADTHIQVSEAKGLLIKLKETETEYLLGREKLAMERIQKVHDEAADLLKDTQTNYDEVKTLLKTVCAFCDTLAKGYDDFKALLEAFDERNEVWDKKCDEWEESTEESKRQLKVQQVKIENTRIAQDARELDLNRQEKVITSKREAIERQIKRLKEGKI